MGRNIPRHRSVHDHSPQLGELRRPRTGNARTPGGTLQIQPNPPEARGKQKQNIMSNRKLRTFSRGLSIHELRRMALGEELIRFCDEEEPKLRDMYIGLRAQIEALIAENAQNTLRLQLSTPDDGEDERTFEERRNKAETRTHEKAANLISMAKDLQLLIDRMSAGGGAAVWAGMQRGMARQQQERQAEERPVKPFRKFGDVHKLQQQSQPVEAEVVEAEGAE